MAMRNTKPELQSDQTIWTYRYLRISMVGAVAALAIAIAIERGKVDCWQTSISAYYYTPVRAIFVGGLLAVALALVAYKGKGIEDLFLNFAGMLAPVVAVAPTTDVGRCWSIPPNPLPLNTDGSLADWVVANIANNVRALLFIGLLGVVVAAFIKKVDKGSTAPKPGEERKILVAGLVVTLGALLVTWWLIETWDEFNERAHGWSALLLFLLLIAAIVANVVINRHERPVHEMWSLIYLAIAVLMVVGALFISATRIFEDHTVLALEAYEIALFAGYWIAQTVENWDERVEPVPAGDGVQAAS